MKVSERATESAGAVLTCGIDVGASAVKVALMRCPANGGRAAGGAVLTASWTERIRRRDPRAVIERAYRESLAQAAASPPELAYVATTGEGDLVEFRTGHFYGMTAHARGALYLAPESTAVLDCGALHARAISIDSRARVLDYRMTGQCASGSGQFLENIARYLGVTLEEIGPLSLSGTAPETVSSICAVLAETDVINMVSRGITVPNILRGIHESLAGRYVKLFVAMKARGVALVTGGLAADTGLAGCLAAALAKSLPGLTVRTHPLAPLAGAIGAALWGAYRHQVTSERDRAA